MDLIRKLRTLLGALAHRPPAPPSRRTAGEGPGENARIQEPDASASPERSTLSERGEESSEAGRVADLIEQAKREEND